MFFLILVFNVYRVSEANSALYYSKCHIEFDAWEKNVNKGRNNKI